MRKKIILTAIVLIIALLCVCLCAACNDKGIGGNGNGDNGNSSESVFSPDMSLDEFVDVMCGTDNYTLIYKYEEKYEDGSEIRSVHINKFDGRVVQLIVEDLVPVLNEMIETYLFFENEVDYCIERENGYYDDGLYVTYPDGNMVISYAQKCMSKYDGYNYEKCVADLTDYYKVNADRYSKYTDKYYKSVNGLLDNFFLSISESNGKLASSGVFAEDCPDDANATEYLEFKDNGIVVGVNYIYDDKQECTEVCIKDVGTTQVDIPDDVRSKKDECEWCDYFEYNYVKYQKGVYAGTGYEYKYEATVQIYKRDEKTIVTVEPVVNGLPVSYISFTFVNGANGEDAQNYEIRLYCDRQGNYCGEYEYLGQVKFGLNLSAYADAYADLIKYYGEW